MQTIKLGATDLQVSRICLGTWQFGGEWGAIDREQAVASVTRARELGVNFFDTAQAYGFGASEELLAQALRGVPREQVVLATKGGLRKEGEQLLRDSSPGWLLEQDDWRAGSDLFGGETFARNLRIVEQLRELADGLGIAVAQLAIAWTLANPAVHVAIVGARRPEHIVGAVPAADVHLDKDTLARIEAILRDAATVAGPTPEGV